MIDFRDTKEFKELSPFSGENITDDFPLFVLEFHSSNYGTDQYLNVQKQFLQCNFINTFSKITQIKCDQKMWSREKVNSFRFESTIQRYMNYNNVSKFPDTWNNLMRSIPFTGVQVFEHISPFNLPLYKPIIFILAHVHIYVCMHIDAETHTYIYS